MAIRLEGLINQPQIFGSAQIDDERPNLQMCVENQQSLNQHLKQTSGGRGGGEMTDLTEPRTAEGCVNPFSCSKETDTLSTVRSPCQKTPN